MARKKTPSKKFVEVTSKSYGNKLKGIKVYFEGRRPSKLRDDGSIKFGKNILELLQKQFERFRWIITEDTDVIELSYGINRVRTSQKTLQKMDSLLIERQRDIKQDIIKSTFTKVYPKAFKYDRPIKYKPGMLANIFTENILKSLSSDDKDALNKFIPEYLSKEAIASVSAVKASVQIKTLKELAAEIKQEINNERSENWWQKYIHRNILIIQQGYIHALDKLNVTVGNTKFPDFTLITHDGFLDILEIKKPSTLLLKQDTSRDNWYWETELSKAIIQVENYLENISRHSDAVRSYIKDTHKIDLKVLRPRGIVLAGDGRKFKTQKEKDDFRLLSYSTKNILFLTYDELVTRLENYIEVLEKHAQNGKSE